MKESEGKIDEAASLVQEVQVRREKLWNSGMVDTARMACKSCKHHFDAGKVGLNDLAITYTFFYVGIGHDWSIKHGSIVGFNHETC